MSDVLAPFVHPRCTLVHGDCIHAMSEMPAQSVGLAVTSPPFADLFVYSRDDADLGNCRGEVFNTSFRFFTEQLVRVMKPGRLAALHTTQLLAYGVLHGFQGLRDFCGDVAKAMSAAGFHYAGEIAIGKNPQSAAQRMKLHNLMFTTLKKDSVKSIPVRNDYLLLFRAPGENEEPVKAYERGDVSTDDWVQLASGLWNDHMGGVWRDIDETNVLQVKGTGGEDDSRHVCPLQLGLIERAVKLWSNPGDLVLDPFSGVGSTGVVSVKLGRRYVGTDLKRENHLTASRTLRELLDAQDRQPTLFALSGAAT